MSRNMVRMGFEDLEEEKFSSSRCWCAVVWFVCQDFVIDRVPFRRWDVYRRKKHAVTMATYSHPNAPSGSTSWPCN